MKEKTFGTFELIPARAFGDLDGCWTIDATTGAGDNGFLDCARGGHPGVGGHGSTRQAVDNLLACLPTLALLSAGVKKTANIVGHGNDGIVVTGTGQNVSDSTKYIAWWNRNTWKAELQRLRGRVAILRLWACHPGTAQEGLDLLNYVCQETGAIVMGPTGFLYCGGGSFTLEANSTWQVVTPGQPLPAPIPAPTAHLNEEITDMRVASGSGYEHIAAEDVTTVEIMSPDGSQTVQELTGIDSAGFLNSVAFDAPFAVDGVPGGIVTAIIRLHFSSPAARLVGNTRPFIVWNDRQLEDAEYRGHFYRAQAGLRSMLRMIR